MPFAKLKRSLKGITLRIAVLAWLVALFTMSLFVLALIPEQKHDLQEALESKALGVASSLRDITKSAAVSDDFSVVVDHSLQVLAGDNAIDYLIITRNDGLSVIVGRGGWRSEHLGEYWHPRERKRIKGLEVTPLFHSRVFRFSEPFDNSGVPWGWIHVGLSPQAYDRSVIRVYKRTGFLVIICVGLSFLISVRYAKRLVRPILTLQNVVRQIAAGDLEARTEIASGDEVSSLAQSFNSMAESISQRNHILESVRFAAQHFLSADDWHAVIDGVLEKMGRAARVDRAFAVIAQWTELPETSPVNHRFEWLAPNGNLAGDAERRFARHQLAILQWKDRFAAGETVMLCLQDFTNAADGSPLSSHYASILMPVKVRGEWWGVLGFDDSHSGREWSDAEQDSFQAAADMLGASIARQHAQRALQEANETLEARVAERTRELQNQVNAKERARADLADAQLRLVELSRQSGMAEIATGVLHNVGNVLNSVNVSATLISTKIRETRTDNLMSAVSLLQGNRGDLSSFVNEDPKGSRVLPYLEKLAQHFKQERTVLAQEVELLANHVEHIKAIVATQQNYAKVSGLVEKFDLAALVRDVLRMVQAGYERHQISLDLDFEDVPPLLADKHKVFQIMLNLLRNAKEAIKESQNPQRKIRVSVRRYGEDHVRVQVKDSGVGLPPENLTRIFAHGFTTKADGHGFGLHSGALAAREMGGSLSVESKGLGFGATFTLELPLTHERGSQEESQYARSSRM